MREPSLKYRADIDGLRAVAVSMVLAYHVGISSVGGGYVGVDVFFVISGYLISSVILHEISAATFSISLFYERRIRRIFPALCFMIAVACALGYRFLLPEELVDFSKSAVAALLSVSNIYFWQESGYFEAPAALKMLLHTWSLGVEEQFYIVLPMFLALGQRFFGNHLRGVVAALCGLSFIACIALTPGNQPAAFYLVPTRAWELLLGTLLAMQAFPTIRSVFLRNGLAAVGVISMVWAGVVFRASTPFPGYAALLPCLGTALVIAAGESGPTLIGRILSLRPVVFIGLISYSLYLWHWPIIVVIENLRAVPGGERTPMLLKVGILVLSVVMATLSWKFVELPFRTGRLKVTGPRLFGGAFAAVAALSVIASTLILAGGMPSRFSPASLRMADFNESRSYFRDGVCFISSKYSFRDFDPARCLDMDPEKKNYLLIGDSHAAHLWYGLSTAFPGVNTMQATASGCKPTLAHGVTARDRCRQLMDYVYSTFLPTHRIDALLIAGQWEEEDVPRLAETMAWAKARGLRVILFGPIVQYDAPLPRLLALAIRDDDPSEVAAHRIAKYRQLDTELAARARNDWAVQYVSFFKTLCAGPQCREYAANGIPMQFDYGHLTKDGSVLVATLLGDSKQLP